MQRMQNRCVRKYVISILLTGIVMATAILTGCGGSGGSSAAPPALVSGVFVDSPVTGLGYSTPTQSGFTDADGTFQYLEGETVTFSAGEIILGSTAGKAVVTPVDLASAPGSSANMKAVNIARFLQLIDEDGDHANGIAISEGIGDLLIWDAADGDNDGSIFDDPASIFGNTGAFALFVGGVLDTLNGASVFTAVDPRLLASRSPTAARRNLNTTISAMSPHPFSPYIKEVGIGVTDLDVSGPFYRDVMGLVFAGSVTRSDRVEASYEDNRPTGKNRVVLMEFNDARPCIDHPVKLVFVVPNCEAAYTAITGGGGSGASACASQGPPLNMIVGMAKDPDGYLIELIEVTAVPGAYLAGVGLGVGSLEASDDFYTRVVGKKFDYYLHLPFFMNEVILIDPVAPKRGIDLVLMNYFSPKVYTNLPVKVVFTVADPSAVSQAIDDEGLEIIQAPSPGVRGIAKDPNGYEVELAETVI